MGYFLWGRARPIHGAQTGPQSAGRQHPNGRRRARRLVRFVKYEIPRLGAKMSDVGGQRSAETKQPQQSTLNLNPLKSAYALR
jgi:hypothetical protein